MFQDRPDSQLSDFTEEFSGREEVCFDAERVVLEGYYNDELSAHRAKRVWKDTLLNYFLLEPGHDFKLQIRFESGQKRYSLTCAFMTACARYSFWRLTNDQTPEAQYLIETAHIPQCDSHREDFLMASDLHPAEAGQVSALESLKDAISANEESTKFARLMKLVQWFKSL